MRLGLAVSNTPLATAQAQAVCLGEGSRTLGQALGLSSLPSWPRRRVQLLGSPGREARTPGPHSAPSRPAALISQRPPGLAALAVEASSGCLEGGGGNGRSKAEKLTLAPTPTQSSVGGS